jgi:hypothetical protein
MAQAPQRPMTSPSTRRQDGPEVQWWPSHFTGPGMGRCVKPTVMADVATGSEFSNPKLKLAKDRRTVEQ